MKTLKNTFLIFIATILLLTIGVFGFIYQIVSSLKNGIDLNFYLIRIAVSLDQFGNVLCGGLLDLLFIKKGIAFGDEDDTISEVISQQKNNLTWLGSFIAFLLEKIDKGHLKRALIE
jgi:hypothetical protein